MDTRNKSFYLSKETFLSFEFLATRFYIIHSWIYIWRKIMHYTKVLNCILYEHVSSIKKYCWNTWHLKHFIAAIKRFCLNNSISIFLQISFKNKSTIGFECVSHLPSANCIHNFMAADFLIFEPSFFFDGHTVWLKFVLLVFICKIDFEKFITITFP